MMRPNRVDGATKETSQTYHFHISKQPITADKHRCFLSTRNVKIDLCQMKLLTDYRCGMYYNINICYDKISMLQM